MIRSKQNFRHLEFEFVKNAGGFLVKTNLAIGVKADANFLPRSIASPLFADDLGDQSD